MAKPVLMCPPGEKESKPMFKRFIHALSIALVPCVLTACGVTQADHDIEGLSMNAPQPAAASNRATFAMNGTDTILLPEDWTCEKRRVNTATPDGEIWKEIPYCKNPMGMEFALIPAGSFKMGSKLPAEEASDELADARPQHDVRITEPFFLGAYEVTNAQFRQFRPDHYSGDYEGASLNAEAQPATCVSQDDARAFCEWLSKQHGVVYELPTEAEWEYACRAGSQTAYPWGEKMSDRLCNFADVNAPSLSWRDKTADDGYAVTAPVGSFPANAFGLYDMIGNVWEWCDDWYGKDYYAASPSDDPPGPPSHRLMNRLLRGGSWMNDPSFCGSAFRMKASQANRSANNGFRVGWRPHACKNSQRRAVRD